MGRWRLLQVMEGLLCARLSWQVSLMDEDAEAACVAAPGQVFSGCDVPQDHRSSDPPGLPSQPRAAPRATGLVQHPLTHNPSVNCRRWSCVACDPRCLGELLRLAGATASWRGPEEPGLPPLWVMNLSGPAVTIQAQDWVSTNHFLPVQQREPKGFWWLPEGSKLQAPQPGLQNLG